MEMAVIDQLRDLEQKVAKRLGELEPLVNEYHELQQVAQRLGIKRDAAAAAPAAKSASTGQTRRRAASSRKTATRRSTGRRRRNAAAPGSRQQDVLRLVTERPGITVPELGRELSVDPTGLYQIVRRLEGRGEIRKVGPRLEPLGGAPATAPEPPPPLPPAAA
jgi:hypothetical protein